jgi:hypothetical protein
MKIKRILSRINKHIDLNFLLLFFIYFLLLFFIYYHIVYYLLNYLVCNVFLESLIVFSFLEQFCINLINIFMGYVIGFLILFYLLKVFFLIDI